MKKEIIIKSIMAAVLSVLLIWLLAAAVDLRSVQKLNLRKTCIASRDIPPRTCITEDDLLEIEIPGDYLLDYTVTDKKEILGRYTDIQGKIPAGSAFYKDMLVKAEDLPDYPSAQLREGQSAYTLETDLAKLGGVVVPGQRADIYASFTARDGTTISGCIIEKRAKNQSGPVRAAKESSKPLCVSVFCCILPCLCSNVSGAICCRSPAASQTPNAAVRLQSSFWAAFPRRRCSSPTTTGVCRSRASRRIIIAWNGSMPPFWTGSTGTVRPKTS